MKPSDVGLPAKFVKFRPNQEDAIIAAACTDQRFVILNMPPGLGKSPTYVGIANLVGGRTVILTQTKGLQVQLMKDFAEMGMKDVRGQNNYPCHYLSDVKATCDDGPCRAGVKCELKDSGCAYYDAVRAAGRAELVVTNYKYWMTIKRFADPMSIGGFDTLVLDEAHEAADTLADFVKINIDRRLVHKMFKVRTPRHAALDEWVEWAEAMLPRARAMLEAARNSAAMTHHWMTSVRKIHDVIRSMEDLCRAGAWKRTDAPEPTAWVPGTSTDWIIEETDSHATFQPVWATGYAEAYLFSGIKRIILVSATVTERDALYLGIPKSQILYKSYPSPFHANNRPIYYIPTTNVSRNMVAGQERIWINRIDQIVQGEAVDANRKGLIHSVSYARAKAIATSTRHQDVVISHDSRNTRAVVDDFLGSPPPLVLVSPAIATGWDFADEASRFQIIAKLPFIDNRPAIVQARHKADKKYLDYVTAVAIIQTVGRIVRGEGDWGRTYIIDDNWRWFYSRNKALFPRWFKSAVTVLSAAELPALLKGRGPSATVLTAKKGGW